MWGGENITSLHSRQSACQCHSRVSLRVNADEHQQQGSKTDVWRETKLCTVKNISFALQ